jgi:hypothetical protein
MTATRGRRLAGVAAALALLNSAGQAWGDPGDDKFTQRLTVQPGATAYQPHTDSTCTVGFLVKDTTGAVYALTGGHCAPDGRFRDGAGNYTAYVGSRTWPVGRGPVVARNEPRHRSIGRYVAQTVGASAYELTYAVIRLDKGIAYDGTVAVLRGPGRQPYTGQTTVPTQLTYVCHDSYKTSYNGIQQGYDDGVHEDVAPRGVTPTSFLLATPAEQSCSGAPVVGFDNTAVALHSGYVSGLAHALDSNSNAAGPPAFRVDAILAAAQKQLHTSLSLVQSGQKGKTSR